jgi:tetratricopeptide (TPR) repeat protein
MEANSTTATRRHQRSSAGSWLEDATALDAFAMVVAALLPVAISPVMGSYTFTPKFAVVLVLAAVGVPVLARRALAGERASWVGAGFLLVALVSATVSGSPLVGFFGMYLTGTGWLFWCAAVGAWAIGRSLSERGRELVASSLVLGAAADALVAVAQQALQLRSPVLGLYQGTQADGLMGNPVFLESILLGATAIVLVRTCRQSALWSLVAALLAAALELSGERFALALLALLAVAAVVLYRSRRAALFVAASFGAYGVTYLAANAALHAKLTRSVTSNPRVLLWKSLAHALAHEVLLGFGPGQTITASTRYSSHALARRLAVGSDFADAHDIFAEVVVTTGLLGLAAFLVFAWSSLRHTSGPLLAYGAMAVAVELVEPLNVGVTPLVLLAIGAAWRPVHAASGTGHELGAALQSGRIWAAGATTVLVCAAVAASAVMLFGDYEANEAILYYRYPDAVSAAHALRVWAAPALLPAQVAANHAAADTDSRHWHLLARAWIATAVERQPTDSYLWTSLGAADEALGHTGAAISDDRRALTLYPYSVEALVGLGGLDAATGHADEAAGRAREALSIAPGYTPARELLDRTGRSRSTRA